jgi:Putative peptidoglycan binding domain
MAWRLCSSLEVLNTQARIVFPGMRIDTVGDAAHASRASDHNPWIRDNNIGVVTAADYFFPSYILQQFVDELIQLRDPRIKYIIHNRKIWRSYKSHENHPDPWTPQDYKGINAHLSHVHLSINAQKRFFDDNTKWTIFLQMTRPPTAPPSRNQTKRVTLMQFPLPAGYFFGPKDRQPGQPKVEWQRSISGYYHKRANGQKGHDALATYQARMRDRGWKNMDADGLYGPKTAEITKAFQREKRLAVDGLIGPQTWDTAFRNDNVT